MLWVAAFLASIIWILGMASGFLGLRIHLFLLLALLCALAGFLPVSPSDEPEIRPGTDPHARSVPGPGAADNPEGATRERAP